MINDVPTRDDPRQPDYYTKVPMAISYNHVRECGRPVYHHVRLYGYYTKSQGCAGETLFEREGTIVEIMKDLRGLAKNGVITRPHLLTIHRLMSARQDGVVASDLQYHRC